MRYAVTSSEMKICDRNTTEHFGIDSAILMERAALKICDRIDEWRAGRCINRPLRCLIICGVGNNGGDGACAARLLLQRGYRVNICVLGDYTKCSDLLLKQLKILEKYKILTDTFSNIVDNKNIVQWDIIIDAMFGIGLSRPVSGDYVEAVNFINQQKAVRKDDLFIVSVDMPSGVNADNGQICQAAVKADATVTFNQVKIGQLMYPGCEQVGRLYVEDAGITGESFLGKEPEAFFYDGDIDKLLPSRKKDSNKGSNGKVLIIAGSTDISGACILCATAALRSGSGMIRVFTSSANAVAVKTLLPEAILDVYEEDENFESKLEKAFEWSTQAVLGPGIGTLSTGKKLVRSVLKSYDKSLVVDADAINIIAEDKKLRNLAANYATGGKRLILTPHLAEFARLYGKSVKECKDNILEYPRLLASELHCTVVCKDARTIIADGYEKKIYINVSGNDGMATAGSGDVLSGIMGAFICDKQSSFEAACLSCYLHGLCGDAAAKRLGKHFMAASDITSELANLLD
ncbi:MULTISPECIES: bifunctional ADP-dependent NAD(P)H-hydrate dehydratase/NAD(P)H-hydrate epimerase [unclassified Butyrivibrio]|uniref:bifunctional ADP-dependent NAD(P)H-hydrate dehydratase/NAD(P)H-hydrate epimerase n=1 Tax=unclassified Butyrivibrio TaxID=2639466 RepID=UPI0003B48CD7|nr:MULTISPECIES: bifunctional ADP-dependent NAD(P)H-hydrate dehydratase/NAD(P)H-hydrate epimerase [unclassified Butyrivibrio]MDC7292213.1 bifunctional ADP-dependent NAD(P)H-hydrate dehydratase/NAD(P)H-hydrate epimerase [Butyrivibrio sp. DSM 10294]